MAFLKQAKGVLVHRNFTPQNWDNFLGQNRSKLVTFSMKTASVAPNLVQQASEILKDDFNPSKYILSHATIVASVDTEEVENVKLGSVTENGKRIQRKWSNYRITPETENWINNNCFVPGTLITMGDGTVKSIEQVQEGDRVLTHRGNIRLVQKTMSRQIDEAILEIKPKANQKILVTKEHPFFVFRGSEGEFIEASNLNLDDLLVVPHTGGVSYRSIEEIKEVPYKGVVYNFDVEEDHSYVANGVAVHNCDAWDRPVLLKSYRTFIGAHNFCEHVQIEEQSKGRIIDAVARDIGPSIYVDILIATNRRHASLVSDIQSGGMNGLSMGCFLEGTQVTLADGTRVAIEEIPPGEKVITHKGRIREVLNKQIKKYVGEIRNIKAIGISSTIRATANHGFEVLRARSHCACGCGELLPTGGALFRRMRRHFKVGHDKRIYNPNKIYSLEEERNLRAKKDQLKDSEFVKLRADELQIEDFLCFPRVNFATVPNDGWTTGKARLIGYFLAEGSFIKYKGEVTAVEFNFSLSEKTTYAQEVMGLLREEFACEPWMQIREDRTICMVHATGRDIAKWFFKHCGEYSHKKKLSFEAMCLPEEYHLHLLGAWMNGDGGYNEANKCLSGVTTSYDLACQIHMLFARCGVFCRMFCRQNNQHVELAQAVGSNWCPDPETGKRPVLTLSMGSRFAQKLKDVCDKIPQGIQGTQHLRVTDTHVIFPITSIEVSHHDGWVYNMEVEEDHTYLVEGVAVHNCAVTATQCTKCGNVAADETEMCACVRYSKGNIFFDERGIRRKVAENCGHHSLDPTGGVTFIEASWVGVPAFEGAVLRNVLEPAKIDINTKGQIRKVLSNPPPSWVQNPQGQLKAAGLSDAISPRLDVSRMAVDFPGFDDEEEGGGDSEGSEEKEPPDPISELENEIEKTVLERVKQRLEQRLQGKPEEPKSTDEVEVSENENINHQASLQRKLASGTDVLLKVAVSDIDLLEKHAMFCASLGLPVEREAYRAVLKVGSFTRYSSHNEYLLKCEEVLGRKPTTGEAKTLVRLGRILSLRKRDSV